MERLCPELAAPEPSETLCHKPPRKPHCCRYTDLNKDLKNADSNGCESAAVCALPAAASDGLPVGVSIKLRDRWPTAGAGPVQDGVYECDTGKGYTGSVGPVSVACGKPFGMGKLTFSNNNCGELRSRVQTVCWYDAQLHEDVVGVLK